MIGVDRRHLWFRVGGGPGADQEQDRTIPSTTTPYERINAVARQNAGGSIQPELREAPPQNSPLASFTYRADGLRHSQTVGATTTYTWDVAAGMPVVLQDGTHSYVSGLGLISQTDAAGNQSYVLSNGLGSTAKLTDGAGTVTASFQYDVFGALRSSSGSATTAFQFTGQQQDAATSLVYLRARYYDPTTGRFLSKDPAPAIGADPASLHRYAYAQNNPTNFVDPTGEIAILPALVVAWAALEVGLTVLDGITTSQTLTDPCASFADKSLATGLFILGVIGPGGGGPTVQRVGTTTVYQAVQNGQVVYVGITDDIVRRAAEHLRQNGLMIEEIPGLEKLPRDLARGVEQALIELHKLGKDGGTLMNKINSIAESNPRSTELTTEGEKLLRGLGILK